VPKSQGEIQQTAGDGQGEGNQGKVNWSHNVLLFSAYVIRDPRTRLSTKS